MLERFMDRARFLEKARKGERVMGSKYLERKFDAAKGRWEYIYQRPDYSPGAQRAPQTLDRRNDAQPSLFEHAGIDAPAPEAKVKRTGWEKEQDNGQGSFFDLGDYKQAKEKTAAPAKKVAPKPVVVQPSLDDAAAGVPELNRTERIQQDAEREREAHIQTLKNERADKFVNSLTNSFERKFAQAFLAQLRGGKIALPHYTLEQWGKKNGDVRIWENRTANILRDIFGVPTEKYTPAPAPAPDPEPLPDKAPEPAPEPKKQEGRRFRTLGKQETEEMRKELNSKLSFRVNVRMEDRGALRIYPVITEDKENANKLYDWTPEQFNQVIGAMKELGLWAVGGAYKLDDPNAARIYSGGISRVVRDASIPIEGAAIERYKVGDRVKVRANWFRVTAVGDDAMQAVGESGKYAGRTVRLEPAMISKHESTAAPAELAQDTPAAAPGKQAEETPLQRFQKRTAWERGLKKGDIIEARWTNSGRMYRAKAKVENLNEKSISIRLAEDLYDSKGNPTYKVGHRFPVPRFSGSTYSQNNGAFPVGGDYGGAQPAPEPTADVPAQTFDKPDYEINHQRDWSWVKFSGTPSDGALEAIKGLGFKFSQKRQSWYSTERKTDEQINDALSGTGATTPAPEKEPVKPPTAEELAAENERRRVAAEEAKMAHHKRLATSLRQKADAMEAAIQNKLNPAIDQSGNLTHRKARIAGGMRDEGRHMQKLQATLRRLADMHDTGESFPPYLDKIETRAGLDLVQHGYYPHHQDRWGKDDKWNKEAAGQRKTLKGMGIHNEHDLKRASAALKVLIAETEVTQRDPEQERRAKIKEMEAKVLMQKIPGFFSTPMDIAREMVDLADIQPGMKVLEPSAGKGNLLEAMIAAQPDADYRAIEQNYSLREILTAKGHALVDDDFLGHKDGGYDRILMNPPFENGQDMAHVQHAYELLAPGGKLIAITGESPFFRTDKKSVDFRTWLEHVNGTDQQLGADRGYGKDHGRATGVSTRMVVIEKPGRAVSGGLTSQRDADGAQRYSVPTAQQQAKEKTEQNQTDVDAERESTDPGWDEKLEPHERDHLKQIMSTNLLSDDQREDALNSPEGKEYRGEGFGHVYYSPLRPLGSWARLTGEEPARSYGRFLYAKRPLTPKELAKFELQPVTSQSKARIASSYYKQQHGISEGKPIVFTKRGSGGEHGMVAEHNGDKKNPAWNVHKWDASGDKPVIEHTHQFQHPETAIGHMVNSGYGDPSPAHVWNDVQEMGKEETPAA
jgi:hypothetical protein